MKTLHYFIIAIFSIIFIFSNNAVFADNIKSTNSFLQKCNDNIQPIPTLKPASVNSSSPKLGILVLQPNSVATLCMKYVKLYHGNPSFEINNTQLIPSIGIEDIQVHGRQISFGTIPVNNVVAKAQQKILSFGSQENASTIISYTLSAKPNSIGYYHVGIPYMCGNILLAVGYPISKIDASSFQDVDPMCFNYGVETSIVGIQGASMTYVDISNKTIHSTKLPENISIIPPLQQMRIYDDVRFIRCNPDLQLIFKSENGSPTCVKSDTATKLVELGWAKEIVSTPVTTTSNMKSVIQNYTGYQSKIIPGPLVLSSCGGGRDGYHSFSNILNSTGFHVFYNITNSGTSFDDDYVIESGHAGTITYVINAGSSPTPYMTNSYFQKELNITNYAVFYHYVTDYEELIHNPSVTIHNGDY